MSLEFDYFYGNEAEQYAFYRIPKLLILICFYTGIRIGELCALTWENIDLKRGVISIENTLYRVKSEKGNKKTELKISTPKSESSVREIPLPKFLVAKLEAIKSGSGFLINKKGKFIEPNVYSRRYKKILAELDIPYRKYHLFLLR